MADSRAVLAKWAVLFVTYVTGPVESEVGREEARAREPDVIAATLKIQRKLRLPGLEEFRAALQEALHGSSGDVAAAARALLRKVEAQAKAPEAPLKKPRWKRI